MDAGNVASINYVSLFATILLGVMTILLPRRFAIYPFILAACYLTLGQPIMISVFHFSMLRIIIFFGWLRIILRGEIVRLELKTIDKAFILWVMSSFFIYWIRSQSMEAVVNRLGFAYDAFGLYFLFRFLLADDKDQFKFTSIFRFIAIAIAPLAIIMLTEKFTGQNIFAALGGVPMFSEIRLGIVRCQGPFLHPILAGTFGAVLVPTLLTLWWQDGKNKMIAIVGLFSATTIVVCSRSSGPLIVYLAGILGMAMWIFRKHMRLARWLIMLTLVALHFYMKAPVYYISAHIANFLGGTGWYRAYLIEQAIAHFNEWWLLGTDYTAHWMPFFALENDPNNIDVTNHFIAQGIQGGLLTLIIFVIMLVFCYKEIGYKIRTVVTQPLSSQIIIWSLGAALFAHIAAFFSVYYFDQIRVIWYLLLALIATIAIKSKELIPPLVAQPIEQRGNLI